MQIIDEVPVEEHDVKMDYIVTEKRVIKWTLWFMFQFIMRQIQLRI
jgi:hypothetical protein